MSEQTDILTDDEKERLAIAVQDIEPPEAAQAAWEWRCEQLREAKKKVAK